MAKPILIVKHDKRFDKELYMEVFESIKKNLENEYHLIMFYDSNISGFDFQVYNSEKLSPIDLEEIERIVYYSEKRRAYEQEKETK